MISADSLKKISLGVALGLIVSAYVHHEQYEQEIERRRERLVDLSDQQSLQAVELKREAKQDDEEQRKVRSPFVQDKPANQFRLTQLLARAEQCFPNAIATVSASGQQRTYAQFGKRVRSAAAGFVEELGVQPGDRIAILSMNSELYLESFFSIPFAGALPVPLNIRLSFAELADTLNNCTARYLFVDEPFIPLVASLREKVKSLFKVVILGSERLIPDAVPLEMLIEQSRPLQEAVEFEGCEGIPSNVYGLFFTGGTTGKAKGAMLTHEGLIFNAYTITNMVRYVEGIKYLHATPMFHLASGTATFGVTMTGGTHVFIPKFTPDGVLRAIQEHKITHALLVPSMFQLLLSVPNLHDYDLRSVRSFHYGGSAMLEKVLIGAMKAFPGAKFVQGYGMTEASPLMTFLAAEHHTVGSPLLTSIGQVVPHGEIKILDQNGQEVPRNQVGEICYRGPNVMAGYYNMPETTAATLRGGWLRTGDGGRMNENGFVFISDRLKDTIVTGGESVYSQEVEQCLAKIDGVLACAVIGIPDPMLVEKVAAIIVVKKGSTLTGDKVLEHCKARIARYKCPKEIIFRTEPLPLSGAGKVLKSVLREPFWQNAEPKTTFTLHQIQSIPRTIVRMANNVGIAADEEYDEAKYDFIQSERFIYGES